MNATDKILITGAGGLVGSALERGLRRLGYQNIFSPTRQDCDLLSKQDALSYFSSTSPDLVFHAAARVYGIGGNLKNKALSFYENTLINTNVIDACYKASVKKVVAMGTVAAYPYDESVKILKEDMIFSGKPHKSEDSYGFAKRGMLAMLMAYEESYGLKWSYVISSNIYGPGDNFNIEAGHVVPSLLRKFYEAKTRGTEAIVWGDGSARRNFIYADDLAKAMILIAGHFDGAINVGTNEVVTIKQLVEAIAFDLGFESKIIWDTTKPNGRDFIPCDLSNLAELGFSPDYNLQTGIKSTLAWLRDNYPKIRS
ncbi:MAG: NAD-dependent epimerase/dehydratase family protein [Deltaproteobacteria bacterium]|jgi:GDP-L-fucose synthase|nr:NAD-dependent epimerase/dehydratase family protein [Deltaproteobacteria bacterium]